MTAAIVLSIASVADPLIDAYEAGNSILKKVSDAMESVERAGEVKDGASKKAWVMAYAKEIVLNVLADWNIWRDLISVFIDRIIKIYNSISKLIR